VGCIFAPRLNESRFEARYGMNFDQCRTSVPYVVPRILRDIRGAQLSGKYNTLPWSYDVRWVRWLNNLIPRRPRWFDTQFDWKCKDVVDLGRAGRFLAEAFAAKGTRATGIDPTVKATHAATRPAQTSRHPIAMMCEWEKPCLTRMQRFMRLSAFAFWNMSPICLPYWRKSRRSCA
jgi:hypothetical protein